MKNSITRWVVTGPDVPVLVFESAGSGCTLREMWNRTDSAAYIFPGPRTARAARPGTVITLTAVRAD
jgi:hypothetical protein